MSQTHALASLGGQSSFAGRSPAYTRRLLSARKSYRVYSEPGRVLHGGDVLGPGGRVRHRTTRAFCVTPAVPIHNVRELLCLLHLDCICFLLPLAACKGQLDGGAKTCLAEQVKTVMWSTSGAPAALGRGELLDAPDRTRSQAPILSNPTVASGG
jgi:hypothetical protein